MSDRGLWWTAFGAIAQAAGAIATFLAVIISLRIASSQRALKAKASAKILVTWAGDGTPGIYHIGFSVLNTSTVPIHVSSLGWRTGWLPWGPAFLTYRYALQSGIGDIGTPTPYELQPNRSAVTLSPLQIMKAAGMNDSRTEMFSRRLPLLGWAPIHGMIHITGRKAIVVRTSADLAAFLRTNDHGVDTDEQGVTNTSSAK